jgi:hypothetical protein
MSGTARYSEKYKGKHKYSLLGREEKTYSKEN